MGEGRYRPSVRGLVKSPQAVFVLAAVLAAAPSDEGSVWFTLVVILLFGGGLGAWHLLENGTAVDGEGFTSTRFTRSISLSWPEVQEVRAEAGVQAVVVYHSYGERLLLDDVPADDVEAIRELWVAGRGEDWTPSLRLPASVPVAVSATTGLGSATAFAAGTGFLGAMIVSLVNDQAGLFEVVAGARQDLVVVLLCLVIVRLGEVADLTP